MTLECIKFVGDFRHIYVIVYFCCLMLKQTINLNDRPIPLNALNNVHTHLDDGNATQYNNNNTLDLLFSFCPFSTFELLWFSA